MSTIRKIIHIDMDAFYAAVEQRDHPEFRGKPVIVAGDPDKRGVVTTCSYEARTFGVHSAMPAKTALKLCPQGIFIHPRLDVYWEESQKIQRILHEFTDQVEPMSLDEAYLDVTENKLGEISATRLAREIKRRIFERTGLTASAGISFNKFLAKVASDMNKPDGLTVVTPEQAEAFIAGLPIRKFYLVGEVTEKKMLSLGIKTGADLIKLGREELVAHFGKAGHAFYDFARGVDLRAVETDWIRKSFGRETTLVTDVTDRERLHAVIEELARDLATYVNDERVTAKTLTLKVKYHDFQTITRSRTRPEPILTAADMISLAAELLAKTEAGKKPIRLLGLSLSNFADAHPDSTRDPEADLFGS